MDREPGGLQSWVTWSDTPEQLNDKGRLTGLCVQASRPLVTRAPPFPGVCGGPSRSFVSRFQQRTEGQSPPCPGSLCSEAACCGAASPASVQSGSAVVCQNELGSFLGGRVTDFNFLLCFINFLLCFKFFYNKSADLKIVIQKQPQVVGPVPFALANVMMGEGSGVGELRWC